jgi:hypothetical protein
MKVDFVENNGIIGTLKTFYHYPVLVLSSSPQNYPEYVLKFNTNTGVILLIHSIHVHVF